MHFPVRGEERVDVVFGEIFRRAVGAIDHPDPAHGGQFADVMRGQGLPGASVAQGRQVQHVAGTQGSPAMTAELTEGEGAFAAQIVRHLQAAAQAQVAAGAGVEQTAEM